MAEIVFRFRYQELLTIHFDVRVKIMGTARIHNRRHDGHDELAESGDFVVRRVAVAPWINKREIELLATDAAEETHEVVVNEEGDAVRAAGQRGIHVQADFIRRRITRTEMQRALFVRMAVTERLRHEPHALAAALRHNLLAERFMRQHRIWIVERHVRPQGVDVRNHDFHRLAGRAADFVQMHRTGIRMVRIVFVHPPFVFQITREMLKDRFVLSIPAQDAGRLLRHFEFGDRLRTCRREIRLAELRLYQPHTDLFRTLQAVFNLVDIRAEIIVGIEIMTAHINQITPQTCLQIFAQPLVIVAVGVQTRDDAELEHAIPLQLRVFRQRMGIQMVVDSFDRNIFLLTPLDNVRWLRRHFLFRAIRFKDFNSTHHYMCPLCSDLQQFDMVSKKAVIRNVGLPMEFIIGFGEIPLDFRPFICLQIEGMGILGLFLHVADIDVAFNRFIRPNLEMQHRLFRAFDGFRQFENDRRQPAAFSFQIQHRLTIYHRRSRRDVVLWKLAPRLPAFRPFREITTIHDFFRHDHIGNHCQ